MKVLYVYDEMPKTYQNYLWLTLEALSSEISLKTLSYKKGDLANYHIDSKSLAQKGANKLVKLGLAKTLRADVKVMRDFDIVHLQHSYLFPKVLDLLALPAAKRPKIVITLRGADTYVKPWVYKKWQEFYKTQANTIDAFVVVSHHQKQYLQKWKVSQDRIYTIPVSFGNPTNVVPKYPNQDTLKVVSAHRMTWEKNIDGNLRTIKAIRDKGVEVCYDIYGDGPDAGQVYYLIDVYQLTDCVTYHKKIENSELKKKLVDYDFFLQLSHSESLGVSVLEAQSLGIPAVVSNRGGLPETIISNVSGICVPPHQVEMAAIQMVDLFKNREQYLAFSKAAIAHVHKNYTVKQETASLIHLYRELSE